MENVIFISAVCILIDLCIVIAQLKAITDLLKYMITQYQFITKSITTITDKTSPTKKGNE